MKKIKKVCKKTAIILLSLFVIFVNYPQFTSQELIEDISAADYITYAGRSLSSGEYYLNQNITGSAGQSGIKVASGATVTIFVSGTVTVQGGNASGVTGAGAGIEVPSNATLKIKGSGSLTCRGGNAGGGSSGSNGSNGWEDNGGPGGAGGSGGGGAGAGIGGHGGSGGAGGLAQNGGNGSWGNAGSAGSSGGTSGVIMLLGTVNVTATGGSASGSGGAGGTGGSAWHKDGPTAFRDDLSAGGGGGGGGGGSGYGAAAIGGGGSGGGGGGGGGRAGAMKCTDGDDNRAQGAGGGSGGVGNASGAGGTGGGNFRSNNGEDGRAGDTTFVASTSGGGAGAGRGSTGGDGASGGSQSRCYKSTRNSYSASVGAGSGRYSGSGGSSYSAYDVNTFSYSFSSCTYNGSEQKPTVSIYYNSTQISNGFTSSYSDNVNATTSAHFNITGSESTSSTYLITGDRTVNFTIKRATFTPSITLTSNSVTYWENSTAEVKGIPSNKGTGGGITWSVSSGKADLTNPTSTTVSYKPTQAGSLQLKATISQSQNYESAYATANVTVPKALVSSFNIADIPALTYTGDYLTPEPEVKYKNEKLTKNSDFSYSYSNNKSHGTGTVNVTGQNNYEGSQSKTFLINRKNIGDSDVTIDNIVDQTYTGSNIVPAPVIHYNNKALVKGTDYNISYVNNKTQGTATINISGIGNFTGSNSKTFKIVPKDINQITLTAPKDLIFAGKKIESRPTLTYNGMTLVEGTDYTLSFSNNLLVGTATVAINGIGNYTGRRTTTYQITKRVIEVKADLNQSKIYGTVEPDKYTYTWENDCASEGYGATFTGRLERAQGEEIGPYEIIQGTLALSTESAKHYTLHYNSAQFYINKWEATGLDASLDGTMGDNDWYVSIVKVVAPEGCKIGYTDSLESENWKDYITFTDGDYSSTGVTYFIRSNENNAVSVAKNIKYKQDTKNPNGSIIIGNDAFTEFLNTITFNLFFNHSVEATINGADSLSGLRSVQYIESKSTMTYDELDAISDTGDEETLHWTTSYTATIEEEKGIIYVKVTDYAGNYIYLNTEGIVYDMDKPELSAAYEYNGVWTKKENPTISGFAKDILAGLKDRYASYTYTDGANEVTQILNIDDQDQYLIEHLPDGHYDLTISAMDNAGNSAEDIVFEVMKDTVTPEIELIADTATISSSQTITFKTTTGCSGPNRIEIYEDGEWKMVEDAFSKGYTATKSDYEYRFRLIDNAKGISEEKVIVFNNIDTEKPVVSYKGLYENDTEYTEDDYTNQQIRVRFQNTSNNKGQAVYEYKLDDGEWKTLVDNNGVCTTSALDKEGHHTFTMRITSQAGIVSEEVSLSINHDITPPVSDITITTDVFKRMLRSITFGNYFNDVHTVHIVSNDPESESISSGIDKIEYFVYQSKKNELLTNIPTTPDKIEELVDNHWVEGTQCTINPDYSYVIFARITDRAGNILYSNTNGLVVDATAPEMDIDYDYHDQWTHNAEINVAALDNLSGINQFFVSIDDGEFVQMPFVDNKIKIDSFSDGEHIVKIKVVDRSENILMSNDIIVKQDNETPTITLTPDDDEMSPSRHIAIEATHDGVSGIGKVEVKLDNGEWIDITDDYQSGYDARENGTFTFRVSSAAGLYAEATTTYNNIYVDALKPQISAFSEDGVEIEQNGWGHGDIEVKMSNAPANVKGIDYLYSLDDGDWENISASDGVAILTVSGEGKHTVSFKEKSQSDTSLESDIETIEFTIDNTAPEVSININDKQWSTYQILKSIDFNGLFKDSQTFTIDAEDSDSGIAHIYYYVDRSNEEELLENEYILASDIETLVNKQWIESKTGNLKSGRSYVIYTKVIDNAGNIKYFSSDGIIIDDLSPEISSAHKEEDWITQNDAVVDIAIRETLSGIDLTQNQVQYSINDGEFMTPSQMIDDHLQISASELDEGINVISVLAKDRVGNESKIYKLIVKKDTVELRIVLTKEQLGDSTTENKLNIECITGESGIQKVEILDGDTWKDITETYKDGFKPIRDGIYTIKLTDGASREISAQSSFSNLDATQPVVDVSILTQDGEVYRSGDWTNQSVNISYANRSNNDGNVKYLHSVDGGETYIQDYPDDEGIFTFEVNAEGTHDVRIKIVNKTGLESSESQIIVNQDMSGPQVNIQTLEGWYTKQNVFVSASDQFSGVAPTLAYSFDGGKTWQNDYMIDIDKNSILDIVVRDAVGNETRITKTIEIDKLEPIVEETMTNTKEWAAEKTVRAVIHDNEATDESSSSGIATVFLTSKNPYKNGKLVKTSPALTDYAMQLEYGNVYKTVSPVTDNLGVILEDNYWIVVIDKAGNATTYTMIVDKIMRDDDNDDNDDSNNPNQPQPDNSDTQKPNQSGSSTQNPSQSSGNGSSNQSTNYPSSEIVNDSMDKINSIATDIHKADEDKIAGFEKILNDLLASDQLSNSEKMIILSTLEQLKKANDLKLNADVVLEIINNDYENREDAFTALKQVDQLLGTNNSTKVNTIQQLQMSRMIIYVAICFIISALIILRARFKYTNKGGNEDE